MPTRLKQYIKLFHQIPLSLLTIFMVLRDVEDQGNKAAKKPSGSINKWYNLPMRLILYIPIFSKTTLEP